MTERASEPRAAERHGAQARDVELERLYQAAQLYYEQGATQAEVAEQLKVSRPSVSRMLSDARAQGIVEIRVHRPAPSDLEGLQQQLEEKLGLQAVHLAPGSQSRRVGPGLASPTRRALEDLALRAGDVMLIASGETTYPLAQQRLGDFSGVVIAPTVGGQAEPDPWHQTNEVVRAFTATNGGYPHYLFAPSMPSDALLAALQDDPGYRKIMEDWNTAKVALIGVGAPPSARNSIAQSVPRSHPNVAKAVGDVCLAFFDSEGQEVAFPGNERMVRIPSSALRAVPTRIAAAAGTHKTTSILTAARAGWFNVLVTDEETAQAILRQC
ncbi:sugar-binding transcriptional regulator [Nesterenkonia alkaliphila]|uniref:sugar-binding transcriptional regulator n=1 Tax=Nesterenkonia alkaliphila TaxID=1463631 RepID=UPI00199E779B|nr:sugar-binding domain-containing protein [Nesterenkonia alkaliphila]GFZ87242.1 transcriptional regulator [Nesterenkonia alkaliphila]